MRSHFGMIVRSWSILVAASPISVELASAQTAAGPSVSASAATPSPQRTVDYVGAAPLPLPIAPTYSDAQAFKTISNALAPTATSFSLKLPGSSTGSAGSGSKVATDLGKPTPQPTPQDVAVAVDFGTANLPFSTARADLDPTATNDQYPYRAAGKLFFKIGQKDYICSASLIKKGLVVTAAHCVSNFGTKTYYSDWQFVPGYRDGAAPYGVWTAAQGFVLTSYFDGTDPCQQKGVVCQNDVAILALNPQKDATGNNYYAGANAGWFSYGWDRTGFASQKITHVTQLGYPGCLDNAGMMQRNDAQGSIDSSNSDNTIMGSLMCGGSSGGPWLVNFGIRPTLTGTSLGAAPTPNQVVGVTSWGSTNDAVKWMGASPFLSSNIVVLVNSACKAYPDVCKD
jgi:V8-like Glu-specific endopeptidase